MGVSKFKNCSMKCIKPNKNKLKSKTIKQPYRHGHTHTHTILSMDLNSILKNIIK